MTIVLDDPTWWPFISFFRLWSYLIAAGSTAVIYDWVSTFEQEFELILNKRWSFMTVLYIGVRYIGILFAVMNFLPNLLVSVSDVGCTIIWFIQVWTSIIVNAMLGVIMIARIYAMYRGSKKLLVFLVVTLLASTIASGVLVVIGSLGISEQEAILSGYHTCFTEVDARIMLTYESVISTAVWEILSLFLAAWVVIKHVRQSPTGSTIGDYFTTLIESHTFYFLAFATVACFMLGSLSPNITNSPSIGSATYTGILSITQMLQMFVLGPRLILSVREHHAKVTTRTNGGIVTSITFKASGDASTDTCV
jgi:hypothetical protein